MKKKKDNKKNILEEQKDNFSIKYFFFVAAIIIVVFLLFNYLFNTFESAVTVEYQGFFINGESNVLEIKDDTNDYEEIKTVPVKAFDTIHKSTLNLYYDNDKKNRINLTYPEFVNDGLSIVNYNSNINLINHKFERSTGFANMIISYGKAYDTYGDFQIDNENYILLSYSNGLYINLYDVQVKSLNGTYEIPVNSILYFEDGIIKYLRRDVDRFYGEKILGLDDNTKITFYYDKFEIYEYTYGDFLKGTGNRYKIDEVPTVTPPIEEPVEVVVEDIDEEFTVDTEVEYEKPEFVYVKPEVTGGKLTGSVYIIKGNIEINDPAGVIVKAPTYQLRVNGKTFTKKSVYRTGEFTIGGLLPSTKYDIIGQYTYLAEDLKTKILVTFYAGTITTGDIGSLPSIDLSHNILNIYSRKVELDNLKITSDLESESIYGIFKISIKINDNDYYLSPSNISDLIKGKEINVSTGNALNSDNIYKYTINIYDRANNLIPTTGNTGTARTCRLEPSATLNVSSKNVDYVTIGINIKNEDNVDLNNYRYEIYNSSKVKIREGNLEKNEVTLRNLDPNQYYTINVLADIDISDGKGVKTGYILGTMDFTTIPLSSLGYLSLNLKVNDLTSKSATISMYINQRKTDSRLINLVGKIVLYLYDDDKIVKTIELSQAEIEKLKTEQTIDVILSNLKSNKTYKIGMKSTSYQGSESYETDCLIDTKEFETNKEPAKVLVTNSYTSSKIIDFDVKVVDTDGAIISDYIKFELKDSAGNIIKTLKLPVNGDVERFTLNNLEENQLYYGTFYAAEYNETNKNETYKTKYELKKLELFTDEGINGSIELISSQRLATGPNLIDMNSNIKWFENGASGALHRSYDKNGDMHIYSKKYGALYGYDLSEYTGKLVKVSFYAKAVDALNYSLYFTNHITGSTSTYHSYKLDVNNTNFKYFEYVYMVGGTFVSNGTNSILTPDFQETTALSYGKSIGSALGFYISGGPATGQTEFVISKFQVQLYDEEEVEFDTSVEKGYWNGSNTSTSPDNKYIKFKNLIEITETGWYKFNFDDMSDRFEAYYRVYNDQNKVVRNRNFSYDGSVLYLKSGQKLGIYFRKAKGNEEPTPEEFTLEARNFKLTKYTGNPSSDYLGYDYKLTTRVKVTVEDLRYEVTNHDYYIRVLDPEGNELQSLRYVELVDTNIIKDVLKEIDLEEKKEYNIELGVKIRDRYYALDYFELSTEDEVAGIKDADEFRWIQPYGNYVLLDDVDFGERTYCIGSEFNMFNGNVDFQGYTMNVHTAESNYLRKFCYIGKEGVLRNLVLNAHLDQNRHTVYVEGFVTYNNGLIEDVMLNINDEREMFTRDARLSLLMYMNNVYGKVNRFVVNIANDLDVFDETGLLISYNRGTVTNGYVYGHDMTAPTELNSGDTTRRISPLIMYGYVTASVKNVYSLVNVNFPLNMNYDKTGVIYYENRGEVENAYTIGDTNPLKPTMGPIVGHLYDAGSIKNGYYYSQNLYTTKMHQKLSPVALISKDFQERMLGSDNFIIDEMLELNYYPHVRFASNKMPNQPYIELPEYDIEQIDIVDMEILEADDTSAKVKFVINNPYGENIDKIGVSNLDSEVLEQTFEKGKSYVTISLTNPKTYTSKYSIRTIQSTFDNKFTSTRKYEEGEKYVFIDFYKEIWNYDDWIAMTKNTSSNYSLKADIDFYEYTNYFIGTFNGKLKGNNHTIKNIFINTNRMGLINYMYGEITDLNVVNFRKDGFANSYNGLFGVTNANSKIINIKMYNPHITIPEIVAGDVYVGTLVGYAPYTRITDCATFDGVIESFAETTNIEAGGLIGRLYSGVLSNSFVDNIDIRVENSIMSYGVGGLVGRASTEQTIVQNSYATGKIDTNNVYGGGIVGYNTGDIHNTWNTVDVSGSLDKLGGIAGYGYKTEYIYDNLAAGSVFSNYGEILISKSVPVREFNDTYSNYAYSLMQINGITNDRSYNGEFILSREELMNEETYYDRVRYQMLEATSNYDTSKHINLGEEFSFDEVSSGILPKLYKSGTKELIEGQRDTYLNNDKFNIVNVIIDKHYNSSNITVTFDNPEHFNIKNIIIDDMTTENFEVTEYENTTIVSFKATPLRYYDSYRLSSVIYTDQDNVEKKVSKKYKLDMQFFKEIWAIRDWQNIDPKSIENYRLMADLDFSNVDKINDNVMFNRLVTNSSTETHIIKNVNLTYTTDLASRAFIKKVVKELSNVHFENINLVDNSPKANNFFNLIGINYGNILRTDFTNITLDAQKENYVSLIGRHLGRGIENINMNGVTVIANSYGSGLVADQMLSSGNRWTTNINATNLDIRTTGSYAGGLYATMGSTGPGQYNHPNTYIKVKDSYVSGNEYVGGIAGRYGDCDYCEADNITVTGNKYVGGLFGEGHDYEYGNVLRNSTITGNTSVGGISGAARHTYDSYVFNSNINGVGANTAGIGGIFGSCGSSYTIARCGVHDTKVTSESSNAGLIGGNVYATYIGYSYVNNSEVVAPNNAGGVIGYARRPHVYYNIVGDSKITATEKGAGGIFGFIDNSEYESGYFNSNLIQNSSITANSYAGGFYGYKVDLLANTKDIYSNYIAANIHSEDDANYGLISGDGSDEEVTNLRQMAFYEGTKINNTAIKDLISVTPEEEKITIDKFYDGYINERTNEIYENLNYYYARYTDYIHLEHGKTYTLDTKLNKTGLAFYIVYYDNNKNILGLNSNANQYIDRWVNNTYSSTISFRVLKDCYIRIGVYDDTVIDKFELTSVRNDYLNISPRQILNIDELRNRITWTDYFNDKNTGTTMVSKMSLSTNYYDFSPLNYEENNFHINDLSGNGNDGVANVSSVSSEGMYFDGVDDFIEINGFKGSKDFTIIATYTHTNSGNGYIFQYGPDGSTSYGYGLYTNAYEPHINLNGGNYGMGAYQYVLSSGTVAMSYNSTTKYATSYKNGRYIKETYYNRIPVLNDTYGAYIGKSRANGYFFQGIISSIMVYNRELSEDEIADIYNSSGTTITDGLVLYYDLTKYSRSESEANYPINKWNNADYSYPYTKLVKLPDENNPLFKKLSLGRNTRNIKSFNETIDGKYHVYASGVDTVNIEFDIIPRGLSFSYEYGDYKSETIDVSRRVYSFNYDFEHDLKLNISTLTEDINIEIAKEDLARSISIKNNNYYYISNNKLYKNSNEVIDNALNIYGNQVLLKNNKIYNLNNDKVSDYIKGSGILPNMIPLYTSTIEESLIDTYYNFSVINKGETSKEQDIQIVTNSNNTYIFDVNYKNNMLVYNTYNTKDYEIVLTNDNTLLSLKTDVKMNADFYNSNIIELTFDVDSEDPVLMFKYDDGEVYAVNYYNGDLLFASRDTKVSLFSYINKRYTTTNTVSSTMNDTYKENTNFVNVALNADNDVVKEKLGIDSSSASKDKYIIYYNGTTNEYETIDVDYIKEPDEEEELVSQNQKIKNDIYLYNYFYGIKEINNIKSNKTVIYILIIIVIVTNLIGLIVRGYKKHEKR